MAHRNIIWMFIMAFSSTGKGQFLVRPQNVYAKVGDSVTLHCTIEAVETDTNPHLQTWKKLDDDGLQKAVSINDGVTTGFEGDYVVQGKYNLFIQSVKLDHGGRYSCENSFSSIDPPAFLHLVILETDTVLERNLPRDYAVLGETVTYTCTISYSGEWAPTITWEASDPGLAVKVQDKSIDGSVRSVLVVQAGSKFDGKSFSCHTQFGPMPPTTEPFAASNQLDYNNTQWSAPLVVYYPPTDIQIIDKNGNVVRPNTALSPGYELICFATSNPPVTHYTWTNVANGHQLAISATLVIANTWEGLMTLECTLENNLKDFTTLDGRGSINITIIALGSSATQPNPADSPLYSNTTTITVIVVLLLVLLAVIVVLGVLFYRHKKKTAKKAENTGSAFPPSTYEINRARFDTDTDSNYEIPNTPYQHPYAYSDPDNWTQRSSWSANINNLVYPGTRPSQNDFNQGRVIPGYLDPISLAEQRLGRGYIDMTAKKKEENTEPIYLELQNVDTQC